MSWSDIVPRRSRVVSQLVPFGLLQRQLNSLLDEIEPFTALNERTNGFNPKINVTENDKELRVSAELPGLQDKDVEISLNRDSLTLRGEKRQECEKSADNKQHYYECSYGSFQRQIPLEFEVEEDKVSAVFKNGVLTIVLPKSQAEQRGAKKISIKAE